MNYPRIACRLVFIALGMLMLAGCQWKMMPTPIAYRGGDVDPLRAPEPASSGAAIDVLYVTDRRPTGSTTPSSAYDSKRGLALRMGVATVQIGSANASWDAIADQSLNDKRPPMRLVDCDEIGTLWTTIPFSDPDFLKVYESDADDDAIRQPTHQFAAMINERLAAADHKHIVLYVPGFNTPFEAPIFMMAQFAHFMGGDGVFIAYSWPARSNFLGYSKQMTTSVISQRNLRQFLVFLGEQTDAERIHLISYSAGAPVVTDALLQLRLMHAHSTREEIRAALKLGHVIYAGGDQDFDYFRNLYLDQFDDLAEVITVYTSRDDAGLVLSRVFTTGTARLGRVIGDLTENDLEALRQGSVTSFIDVTDATRAAGGGDIWSHGYWYLNPWVNMDVIAQLRYGLAPEDRGLVREDGEAVWSFPRDYPDRITQCVRDQMPAPTDEP
jgi:esterase/lipase superfamily enzyme